MVKPSKRQNEDKVLDRAKNLDPKDNSPAARQLRETAESIEDHRSSEQAANTEFWER